MENIQPYPTISIVSLLQGDSPRGTLWICHALWVWSGKRSANGSSHPPCVHLDPNWSHSGGRACVWHADAGGRHDDAEDDVTASSHYPCHEPRCCIQWYCIHKFPSDCAKHIVLNITYCHGVFSAHCHSGYVVSSHLLNGKCFQKKMKAWSTIIYIANKNPIILTP